MAVATVSIKTTLEDVLECPICTDTYTDPRSLPCVHTFCLKCIREWNTDRIPGDEVSCPLCREKFTVPENGLDALPKNFFIAKLLLVKESQNEENQASLCTCEICSEVENNLRNKNLASMYCVDCEQKICKSCCAVHKNYKAFRNHRLVPLDEQTGAQELSSEYSPATCIRHADEQLKIYCLECKVVVCLMCYIEQHNSHKFSDINKMIDQLRQQMTADVDGLGKAAENLRRVLVDVNSEKEAYNRRVTEVENEICEQAKKLIAKIESDKQGLLVQLAEEKNNRIKQVNQLHGDIEQHILLIEGLKKYGEKLTKDGTSSDISRESNVIHDRASELMKYDTLLLAKKKLARADVIFAPSKLLSGDNVNVTGRLRCSGSKGSKPTLTQVIAANNGSVSGLTSVGDQLFVVRYGKLSVEVYDTATLKLVRNIQIPNASYLWGAASSTVDNCVYVADHSSHKLHKIELSSNDNVKTWSVAQHPTGLSVNKANNILVCSYASHKIQEYAVNGELVREIVPQVSAKRQFHAVELHLVNNQYALSHASGGVPSQFNLSVVGSDGHISHQSPPDLVTKLAQGGGSLATDSEDNTLACEWQNNQVIVLNSTLTTACRLPLDVDGGLKQPFALHLDETRDRLYVGEWSGQRVLVFDNVFDIGSYLN